MNRFQHKLAQMVCGARVWNSQLWGSADQRSRSHGTETGRRYTFWPDISRTVGQIL